jgi:F-type H+-transporting ATPase subunit delta
MVETKVASRYAKSLLGLAIEQGILDAVKNDMSLIAGTCATSSELTLLLNKPIVSVSKKIAILTDLFGKKINPVTLKFLTLITKKRREPNLEAIANEFVGSYKEYKQIETVVITSAFGLDEKLRKEVLALVKKDTKSEIELVEKVDKSIIGGFIIKKGDKEFDASILKKLNKIKQEFNMNAVVSKN